jgi:hypothetical protein
MKDTLAVIACLMVWVAVFVLHYHDKLPGK